VNRRDFLYLAGGAALLGSGLWRYAVVGEAAGAGAGPYGPLLDPDENGIMLPAGFRSRVIARSKEVVPGTKYVWHVSPDGGATFVVPGGWVYASNSEFLGPVGAGAIRFDTRGDVIDAYPILTGTVLNCAGGKTPWGTWLSCEEHDAGHVWECDPTGVDPGVKRPALGTFKHEAVAPDRRGRALYLTEDVNDGCLYRFRPARWADLSEGILEAAAVDDEGTVSWLPVPAPNDTSTPTRYQAPGSTPFRGGEGIAYRRGHVYFTTKGDNHVWDYDVRHDHLRVLYDASLDPARQLTGVDNVTVSWGGDVLVAEDGGNMELVMISRDGVASPLLRIVGQNGSEIAGPAFDPRGGRHLYFSSQRGGNGGITYEVTGPFRHRAPRLA